MQEGTPRGTRRENEGLIHRAREGVRPAAYSDAWSASSGSAVFYADGGTPVALGCSVHVEIQMDSHDYPSILHGGDD